MAVVTCPRCGARLQAPESILGKRVTCGQCKHEFIASGQVPGPVPSAPGPPPVVQQPPAPGPVPPGGGYYGQPATKTSGYAVASLILGIASIPTCLCYGVPAIVCGILALVFSSSAVRAVAAGEAAESSLGMAKAGKICGAIGLVLAVVIWVILVLFWVYAARGGRAGYRF